MKFLKKLLGDFLKESLDEVYLKEIPGGILAEIHRRIPEEMKIPGGISKGFPGQITERTYRSIPSRIPREDPGEITIAGGIP